VVCPCCHSDQPVQLPEGINAAVDLNPSAYVCLIPQSADLIQSIRRSKQMEDTELQPEQQLQQAALGARCACGADCAAAATVWCEECEGELCAEHDAALHAAALASHRRAALGDKVAARQAKIHATLSVAGSQLKSDISAAVQQLRLALEQQEAGQKRVLMELRTRLAALTAAAAEMDGLSDAEAHQHQGAFGRLLPQPAPCLGGHASIYHSESRPPALPFCCAPSATSSSGTCSASSPRGRCSPCDRCSAPHATDSR